MTNKKRILSTAKELINLAIKNSEIVQPFVKPKHYVKGLMVLNGLYLMLKFNDTSNDNSGDVPVGNEINPQQ